MDHSFHILEEMTTKYDDAQFNPRVHAEVQILDHFHLNGLRWLGDRFIACSKPACYCCHLYIRHHPAECVVPETHRKIYLNWGPRLLPGGCKNERYNEQLQLFIKMTDDIRRDVVGQLEQGRGPHEWHPDSNTLLSRPEPVGSIGNLGAQLQNLQISSFGEDESKNPKSLTKTACLRSINDISQPRFRIPAPRL